jgi:crotonobetaine/carnitine-CoA ligase
MMVVDADGWYFFYDRVTDSIRRRGENVSSWEVESAVAARPEVAEAAVIGVESKEWGEHDILAVVVPAPGAVLDPATLAGALSEALPSFMVPRYIRVIDALPRSEATHRIQKGILRGHGVDRDTWDRQAHR